VVPERVGAFLKNVNSEEHVAEMSIPKNTCSANLAMNAGAAAAMKKVVSPTRVVHYIDEDRTRG